MHSDYLIDGVKAPSATELTRLLPQDWLFAWYKRAVFQYGKRGWQLCNAQSNRAMRLGTHTHALVEADLKHEPAPTCWLLPTNQEANVREPERRMKLVRAWAKALVEATCRHQIKEVEHKTVDRDRREHGTVDAIAVEDDNLYMFPKDWKTSGSISKDYIIQLAIYNRCLEAEGYKMAGYGEIERVDKELKSAKARVSGEHHVQIKRFNNLARYYPVIDALHTVYDYVNGLGAYKKVSEE